MIVTTLSDFRHGSTVSIKTTTKVWMEEKLFQSCNRLFSCFEWVSGLANRIPGFSSCSQPIRQKSPLFPGWWKSFSFDKRFESSSEVYYRSNSKAPGRLRSRRPRKNDLKKLMLEMPAKKWGAAQVVAKMWKWWQRCCKRSTNVFFLYLRSFRFR